MFGEIVAESSDIVGKCEGMWFFGGEVDDGGGVGEGGIELGVGSCLEEGVVEDLFGGDVVEGEVDVG